MKRDDNTINSQTQAKEFESILGVQKAKFNEAKQNFFEYRAPGGPNAVLCVNISLRTKCVSSLWSAEAFVVKTKIT